ncbi:tetratricopeptide repeat-containing glycosyltransferase family 2 protein [Heliorestis convoluta]|uniref:Glycosyltransferase n=1 Tax=Heliorestis convoluta TaxID=356322 RepID=A0A5Q2N4P4_9FIRM|nr:glycosyltransferase [Heliorestis convoluta]QGG48903.1 glycosyltransferase [Heliorestis convoluta]
MKISACMITKNEEKNIERSIQSYKNIVNEIIVVDTGSTDKTVEIAEELGAKVYYFEWVNDFSKAKNYAISKAKGNWIIFLDADEYFDEKKAANIPKLIKKYGHGNTEIIACKMINIDEDSGEYIADFTQARIFKNSKNVIYVNAIHERLHSINKKKLNAAYVDENELVIYHTGYSTNRIKQKAERNLSLLLREIEDPQVNPTAYHFLSDAYLTLKDYENAIYYGRLYLKQKVDMQGLNSKVYQNLISAMVEAKYSWEDVFVTINEAIEKFPDHPMFYMYLARAYHFTLQYEKALKAYEKTLAIQEKYKGIEINFITGKIYEIEHHMACIYELKNEDEKALSYYIAALKRKKDYLPALQGLLKLIRNMSANEVIALLNQIYDKNSLTNMSYLVEELTKQRFKEVLAYYVSWMYNKYNHQDFSLVVMFLTNGKYDHAFKHFYEAYLAEYDTSYARLAIISGYLNNNSEALLKLNNVVKPSQKRIIEALLFRDQETFLYKEDLKDYLDIFTEIVNLEKEVFIGDYLSLKNKFKENIGNLETVIGNIFKENRLYEKAIEQYKKQLEKESEEERKYLCFNIGYCYFKNKNFEKSLVNFEEALESGYLENDILSFLLWTQEQTNDKEIQSLALNQIDQFHNLKKEKQNDVDA